VQIRVSSSSAPNAVSAALIKAVVSGEPTTICAVGAAAINQAVKATAVARADLVARGIDLLLAPGFEAITIDGERRVSVVFGVVTAPLGTVGRGAVAPDPLATTVATTPVDAVAVIDLTDGALAANGGQSVIDVRRPRVNQGGVSDGSPLA
jgi:stage V sporulation protein S